MQALRGAAGQGHLTSLAATTTARSVRHTATREPPCCATVPHHHSTTCSISGIVTVVIGFSGSKRVRILAG